MFQFLSSIFSKQQVPESIYDFKVPAIDGGFIDFSNFKGLKILIVNTASLCGKTPQYEGLERLHRQYQHKLVVVGFPANNFLFQEPGANSSIAAFCRGKYAVSFPLAAKVSVRGINTTPLYRWLTQKKYNGVRDSRVTWNFQKYLIDEHGRLADVFSPSTSPEDPAIIAAIER